MNNDKLVDLVKRIIRSYTLGDATKVGAMTKGGLTTVVVQTSGPDHPLTVGKQGRNIEALKRLFAYIGEYRQYPISILLTEPFSHRTNTTLEYVPAQMWDHEPMLNLLTEVTDLFNAPPPKYTEVAGLHLFEVHLHPAVAEPIHTLWHAAGKVQGVTIHVEAAQ